MQQMLSDGEDSSSLGRLLDNFKQAPCQAPPSTTCSPAPEFHLPRDHIEALSLLHALPGGAWSAR